MEAYLLSKNDSQGGSNKNIVRSAVRISVVGEWLPQRVVASMGGAKARI